MAGVTFVRYFINANDLIEYTNFNKLNTHAVLLYINVRF
jgi:hypothetical protein